MKTSTLISYFFIIYIYFYQTVSYSNSLHIQKDIIPLNKSMLEIKNYVPKNIVIAHRGTTYWAPESTEAAYRWARNIGADYLEADLQITQDGIIVILHDDQLTRTSNISDIFPDRKTNPVHSFTYKELLKLDTGSWFNKINPQRAKKTFKQLEVITLEDLVKIAEGYRIKRQSDGSRVINPDGTFSYTPDLQDSGHRPGIYIEFKEPNLNPGIEDKLKSELTRLNWNIIKKPSSSNLQFNHGKVNVGKTNAKVILQTFSKNSLEKINQLFKGNIPTLFLIEYNDHFFFHSKNQKIADLQSLIQFAVQNNAHFIGPSIAKGKMIYYKIMQPWQSQLIHQYGLGLHPYTFDTIEQMELWKNDVDGMFTNRADLSVRFYQNLQLRPENTEQQDPQKILELLGYE